MKKLLFLIIFFYTFLLSMNLFPAERVTHHLILGGKIHGHFTVRKDSPYVPVEGSGKGGGIGFYTEVIPFPYAAFESGLYIRSFNLGRGAQAHKNMCLRWAYSSCPKASETLGPVRCGRV